MSYALSNHGEVLRSLCDVAFEHLRRLIVVDEDARRKWQAAFKSGEIECERLGAVHLLLHEIWAFKVSGTGERTDLIFPVPPNPIGALTGLVLTEWKVSKAAGRDYFGEAFKQARSYSQGVLAATELATHRYLVVVSDRALECPEDRIDSGITFRHINIPVRPETPSKAARRKSPVEP
jgi:hypothetical protein